ncbi:MAG TPA: SLC13 family permease [Devosiaceae bacterium]
MNALTILPDSAAMWATLGIILVAMLFYGFEWASIELVSLGALVALMALGMLFPLASLSPDSLLTGFSNPAMITILALLVTGQALIQTEALSGLSERLSGLWPRSPVGAILLVLLIAGLASSVVNNTPIVVVFIPVLAAILSRREMAPARYMMSLSFASILGGMTTLLGSSTNLLAAGVARAAGVDSVTFFSFTVPGLAMAAAGGLYVLFVVPRIVADNSADQPGRRGRAMQFITEIRLTPGHPLIGDHTVAGMFPKLTNMTVRAVKRGRTDFLPPFDDITLQAGDTLIVAATRDALTEALRAWRAFDGSEGQAGAAPDGTGNVVVCEALVPPGSRLVNNAVDQAGFLAQHGCLILGVERRSRMPRQPLSEIRLEAGDVLLISGRTNSLERMRGLQDLIVIEWSASEVKPHGLALRAQLIFAIMVVAIAAGLLPNVVAAVGGAFAMIATGCINIRQAARAVDRKIILLVGSSIAMATALDATGGARAIADLAVAGLGGMSPAILMSGLFIVVALITNVLSNNATAVLFTPIAIATANRVGIDPLPLIATVILGANASFASPIGYQTNLLVMGAGHYRFRDFFTTGAPLVVIVWIVFSIVAPWWYGV